MRHRQLLHERSHYQHARTLLAIWISLALILTPAALHAAPAAATLAQTTAYEDADGRYSLNVPDDFTEEVEITYDMLGDNPLDKLVASAGLAFTEPETPNGVSVLFLLLDESISDRDEFAGFLAAFQTAAGGDVLPLVDLEFIDDDALHATGRATTRLRNLQIDIEVQDNVAAIVTANVERKRYGDLRHDLSDALDSFTWDADTVRTSLGGEVSPTPDEPTVDESVDEPVDEEPTDEEPTDAEPADTDLEPAPDSDSTLEIELYSDPEGIFSIALPAGLEVEDLSDDTEAIYGFGYFGPEDSDFPTVAVAFTPAAFAAQGAEGEIEFREIDDEEWHDFVDTFLIEDLDDMTVFTDLRDEVLRTAFVILEAEEGDDDSPSELWVWAEESNGIGAVIAIFGELDDPDNAEIFHEALTSFTWSPERTTSMIADLAGVPDPAEAPVSFDDPFELIEAATPPDYPFQSAYFEEDSLEYSFGRNALDGLFRISLSSPSDGAYNESGWSIIVDETEKTVMGTLSDGSLGANARLVDTDIGEPDVGADNSAVILARTDVYWMAVVLLDRDGVLVSEVIILPDSYWQDHEDVIIAAAEQGVDFDPDTVRDAIDANQELGAAVVDTGMASEAPKPGEEFSSRYTFDTDDPFTVVVDFVEPDLSGMLKAIIYADDLDYPLAINALWLGEELQYSTGKMTSQDENGTRAAFTYRPDFPNNPGDYTVNLYYDNDLVVSNAFTIRDNPPEETELSNFGASYGDAFNGEPLLVTTAIHPDDFVTLRGTGDLPAGSQLRLFWYDQDGILIADEVETIRLDSSHHLPYDWIYFEPDIDWLPGFYSWLLTIDGEPLIEGDLFVIEETAAVELTSDPSEIYANLPVPSDLEIATVVEGIDVAVAPPNMSTATDVVSAVDAWLRMQGWQPALPSLGAPVAWDYRRWTKDGYQFILEPGSEGYEDELWMRYAPLSDTAFGPLPAEDALSTENLDAMAEVAQLEIEGLTASEAAISPDGNWLAVTTKDGTLYIFDALRLLDTIWYQPDVFYANPVFSPDSRDLAVTLQRQERSEIQLFRNFDVIWLPTTRLNGHTDMISAIDYQPDGWLASGGLDSGVRFWDSTGAFLPSIVEMDKPVTGVAAAPEDAAGLLVGKEGGWVDYLLDDGDEPWVDLGAITESPRIAVWSQFDEEGVGDLVVYGEGQAEWYAYDTTDAELIADLPEDDADFASTGAAISPNGELLAISGPYVSFYDRISGAPLDEWQISDDDGELESVNSLRISPDGRYFIVVSDDGIMRLWAVAAQ